MTEKEKEDILIKAKTFFRNRIASNHQQNTRKLKSLKNFNINPFTAKYLAQFTFGNSNPESIAKVLLYPRILGTSISTTFGTQLQYFCNEVLSSYASTTSGIDIEFIDTIDGRKKFCQVKAGPTTINHDDVTTIKNHFRDIRNLARTNHLDLRITDCIVGVFMELKKIFVNHINESMKTILFMLVLNSGNALQVIANYFDLINAFADVANEIDSSDLINNTIQQLSKEIANANK